MTFCVKLTAAALVETTVYVDANSRDTAEGDAIQQATAGDVVWKYAGVMEHSQIFATSVSADNPELEEV